MKVSGYMLREAIKQHALRRDTASQTFDGSLKAFPGDDKPTPQSIVEQFLASELAIAQLQVAQMRYNLAITVEVTGVGQYAGDKETMSLAEAIKRVGGEGRSEKMWRSATGPKKDRYSSGYGEDEIDPSRVRSKATITPSEAVRLASLAGKRAGVMRAAIATANAKEIEIDGLSPALFE